MNKQLMLPLNLQLFAGDEDGFFDDSDSLPADDIAEDTIEQESSDFEQDEVTEPTSEDTPTVEEVKEDTPQQRMLKLKVDREEQELPEDEVIRLAQIGKNQDRAIARAQQEARDNYIKEQGYTWNDKPITNEAEYKQAIAEKEMMDKYKDKDLPPEVIQELIESRRDREERAKEKQAKQEEEKYQKDYNEFFNYFESVNKRRFDPKTDTLPQEVIDAANAGQPLKYAYMEHFTKQLRNSLKTAKQNETNSKRAPVASVTAHGSNAKEAEDEFLLGFNSN